MISRRNKKKVALATAVAATASMQCDAAVSAIASYDGVNDETLITLNFTDGEYTPASSKSGGQLLWDGLVDSVVFGSSSSSIDMSNLLFTGVVSIAAASLNVDSNQNYSLHLATTNSTGTITGGYIELIFNGMPTIQGSSNLTNGSFSNGSDSSITASTVAAVPEPNSSALLALSFAGLLFRRKK